MAPLGPDASSTSIILRKSIEEFPLAITETIQSNWENCATEQLKQLPDLYQLFKDQIDKFKAAFIYLKEACPPNGKIAPTDCLNERINTKLHALYEEAMAQLAALKNEGVYTHHGFDNFQRVLVDFNTHLIGIIAAYWQIGEGDNAEIDVLNLAEQYETSNRGRKSLASLSKLRVPGVKGDKFYTLQVEETLNPCNPEFIGEVRAIAKGIRHTPAWFSALPCHVQALLLYGNNISNYETFSINLNLFRQVLTQWLDEEAIFLGDQRLQQLDKGQRLFLRRWSQKSDKVHIAQALKELQRINITVSQRPVYPLINEDINKVRNLPEWYLSMSDFEQSLFYHKVQGLGEAQDKNIEQAFQFISSKHRTIPIPANLARHNTYLFKNGHLILKTSDRLRSAHGASRDVIGQTLEIQNRHALGNYTKIIELQIQRQINQHIALFGQKPETIPVLLQTLISPVAILDGLIPDPALDKQKQRAIIQLQNNMIDGVKIDIISTNHPFNYARVVEYTGKYFFTNQNDENCKKLLRLSREYLSYCKSQQNEIEIFLESEQGVNDLSLAEEGLLDLKQLNHYRQLVIRHQKIKTLSYELGLLNEEYERTLYSDMGSATFYDYNGREAFLSSQERLIESLLGGINHGSCVSGKDRKAIETLHTDAMEIFREVYHEWPSFHDKPDSIKRQNFVDIIAQLFMTRHQQVHASQNSPGCEGLKTPAMYLPNDVCKRINELARFELVKNTAGFELINELLRFNLITELECVETDYLNNVEGIDFTQFEIFNLSKERFSNLISGLDGFNLSVSNQFDTIKKFKKFNLTTLEDSIATNNELKRIGMDKHPAWYNLYGLLAGRKKLKGEARQMRCKIQIFSLEESTANNLLSKIIRIAQDSGWDSEVSRWGMIKQTLFQRSEYAPLTVNSIRKIDEQDLNSKEKLNLILEEVVKAGNGVRERSGITQKFYDTIHLLYEAENPNQKAQEILRLLDKFIETHIQNQTIKTQNSPEITC